MPTTKPDWRSEWKCCVRTLADRIISDKDSASWKVIKRQLKQAYGQMELARQGEHLNCLVNLREATRYLKYTLADCARHTQAFKAAAFQNDCSRKIALHEKHRLRYIGLLLHSLVSKYNTSILHFACTVLIGVLIFALLYLAATLITGIPAIVDSQGNPARLYEYPYFSIVTFTTLGFGDYKPNGSFPQYLAAFEALGGYLALGFLVYLFAHLSEIHPYGPDDWMESYQETLERKTFL